MPSSGSIIGEYLYKIGWQVDKLPDIEKSLNTVKFIELGRALFDIAKAFADITKEMASFVSTVLKADMQTQIFARRLLTTVSNARSLQSVMGAMGINNIAELRDVALNPTLRAQFVALRKFTQGLEPGPQIQSGIGNLREVTFQLQKINVLFTYFSQYVVGLMGKILEPTLKQLSEFLDEFSKNFKSQILPIANKVAFWVAYIFRLFQVWGQIFGEVFRILKEMRVDRWLKVLMAEILVISLYIREIAKKLGVEGLTGRGKGTAGAAATGAAIGMAVGGPGGAAIGAAAGATYANKDLIEKGMTGLYDDRFFPTMGRAISKWGPKAALWDLPINHLKNYFVKPPDGSTAGMGSSEKRIVDHLVKNGLSLNGAIAVLANAKAESGLRTNIPGDGGTSIGLFQWHNERWKRGSNFLGKNLQSASVEEQLSYMLHELKGYPSLMRNLKSNMSARHLAGQFARDFERPHDVAGQSKYRGDLAQAYSNKIEININGYNRDPKELSTHVKQVLSTRVLQPAAP